MGLLMVVLLVIFVLLAAAQPNPVARATAGFAVLSIFLTEAVWNGYWDISRALAPIFTAAILLVWQQRGSRQSDDVVEQAETREGAADRTDAEVRVA